MTIATLKRMAEHAPPAAPSPVPNLLGFWHHDASGDVYVCSPCAGRLNGRGIMISPATPVWADRAEPIGVCACCGA